MIERRSPPRPKRPCRTRERVIEKGGPTSIRETDGKEGQLRKLIGPCCLEKEGERVTLPFPSYLVLQSTILVCQCLVCSNQRPHVG